MPGSCANATCHCEAQRLDAERRIEEWMRKCEMAQKRADRNGADELEALIGLIEAGLVSWEQSDRIGKTGGVEALTEILDSMRRRLAAKRAA